MFFFNDTATTEIYTLSLHDALPIFFTSADTPRPRRRPSAFPRLSSQSMKLSRARIDAAATARSDSALDRKSTRLNSSHANISYAVFCLKKNIIVLYIFYLLTHTSLR